MRPFEPPKEEEIIETDMTENIEVGGEQGQGVETNQTPPSPPKVGVDEEPAPAMPSQVKTTRAKLTKIRTHNLPPGNKTKFVEVVE